MSEDSVLHDEAGLQGIYMEKVVGDSSIQKIYVEHLPYTRHHYQCWGRGIAQSRQKSHPLGVYILVEDDQQIIKTQ